MYAILAIALVCLGGSYGLFYYSKATGGWATTNHGAFVTPAVTIADLGWRDASGAGVVAERWWVWQVSAGCARKCVDVNRDLQSLQTLLNKQAHRVRLGFTDLTGASAPGGLAAKQIHMDGVDVDLGIYIVDPIGNLVFHYSEGTDPALILEDLKRLLKVSQIG